MYLPLNVVNFAAGGGGVRQNVCKNFHMGGGVIFAILFLFPS